MNSATLSLAGAELVPLPAGALWWPETRVLAVGDLHLGRAERIARREGRMLPPYETRETLDRLDEVIRETDPATVISLGDAFDDLSAAEACATDVVEGLCRMAAGRRWIWIAGNHDPGPVDLPGSFLKELAVGPLMFRHAAAPCHDDTGGEISGHFHPKMRVTIRGQRIARTCFLTSGQRLILPAFGTYTGGLDITSPVFGALLGEEAVALLTGRRITALPVRLAA
ncbi:MAG: ligase-associated DNA damage response endonuclease PdeM [Pseudomonadota bacterium]